MTYNPRTNEIYVALYTALRPENAGCIFVMDPDTLSFKNSIKIADGYNILGIEYLEDSDEYMIITNDSGGYSIKRLDANFQVIDDFGPTSTSPGVNYQDFCVDGDYLLISPLTFGMGIGEYVNIFSISRRGMIQSAYFNPGDQGAQHYEPESICEPEPGVFLMPVTATGYDGSMYVYFYQTVLPYYFTVEVTSQTVDTATLSDSGNEKLPYNADTMKTELSGAVRSGGNVKTAATALTGKQNLPELQILTEVQRLPQQHPLTGKQNLPHLQILTEVQRLPQQHLLTGKQNLPHLQILMEVQRLPLLQLLTGK